MHMLPVLITDAFPTRGRWYGTLVSVSPLVPNEMVILLAPQHAGQGLSLDVSKVICHRKRADTLVELVSLKFPLFDYFVEVLLVKIAFVFPREPKSYHRAFTRRNSITLVKRHNERPSWNPGNAD